MNPDTSLIKNKDIMQEVLMAMTDLKKSKGVSAKEIINFIADRSDALPDKKTVATRIKKAIVNGLKTGMLVEDNGLFSINKLNEIPGGLNFDVPLTELRRRRGRRRRGRRRGRRRRRRRDLDANRTLRINVQDVVERLIKEIDEGKKKENYESPIDDSESPSGSSLKDLTELRRRRRRRSRGRRRRRRRDDIYELRRRRRRGRRGGRRRRRRRRSIDGCVEL